jgi:hypothetical protein
MDVTPWVERYAWFGALRNLQGVNELNRLMDQHGRITDLGRQYIGAGNDFSSGLTGAGESPAPAAWIRLAGVSLLVVLAGHVLLLAMSSM